jgi:tRNA (cmo5U34)-methyltransferase
VAVQPSNDNGAEVGWDDPARARWYLDRIGTLAPRLAGEEVLRQVLPSGPVTLLDLGCGDGRLAALALQSCPTLTDVVAVDLSPPMLEQATARFRGDRRVTVRQWDLGQSIESLGSFDVILSGFAIHHLPNDRKRGLFAEIGRQLHPDGLFANLEVTASATPELHAQFLAVIGRTADDPEDRLVDTKTQAEWMRQAGLEDVYCLWRWRGFALLVGRGPSGRGSAPD